MGQVVPSQGLPSWHQGSEAEEWAKFTPTSKRDLPHARLPHEIPAPGWRYIAAHNEKRPVRKCYGIVEISLVREGCSGSD